MIDFEEHFYSDDPANGHPDVRTRLNEACYFFLGNGLIQAAIQFAPGGEGSPYGLLVMDPEHLGLKRDALTLDHETGIVSTMVRVRAPGSEEWTLPDNLVADWTEEQGSPAVRVRWSGDAFEVEETFFCPSADTAELHRRIRLRSESGRSEAFEISTGLPGDLRDLSLTVSETGEALITLSYRLTSESPRVVMHVVDSGEPLDRIAPGPPSGSLVTTGYGLLDRFFNASCSQLPAVISRGGVVDASIWQYNREWVRDHSAMAVGLTLTGQHALARTLLDRLLEEFVSTEGDAVDSSERRSPDEVELDQNGELLHALETYLHWTGDASLLDQHWERVVTVAEYPFRSEFLVDPPGLLANRRDYWERHSAHGIETGFELAYQFWNIIGLSSAATLARARGEEEIAARWEERSARLRHAFLDDPVHAMHDERGLIKRRGLDGTVQETIEPREEALLPEGTGLLLPGEHRLDPDTSTALPIAMGVVDPASPLAIATMEGFEQLWDQGWSEGGYGRYNITSEADQPGSWPFPSLFVARAAVESGDPEKVVRILEWLDTIPGSRSCAWFENYGERVSPPYPQVGVPPWMWAEIIMLVVHHIVGVRPGERGVLIRPRLLPGMDTIDARLKMKGHDLRLRIVRDRDARSIGVETDGEVIELSTESVLIAGPEGDISMDIRVP